MSAKDSHQYGATRAAIVRKCAKYIAYRSATGAHTAAIRRSHAGGRLFIRQVNQHPACIINGIGAWDVLAGDGMKVTAVAVDAGIGARNKFRIGKVLPGAEGFIIFGDTWADRGAVQEGIDIGRALGNTVIT